MLDEKDDRHPAADGKAKTLAGSTARLARMVGRDAAELDAAAWNTIAAWFSERQLRSLHDAAIRVGEGLPQQAPILAAGIGHWQIGRLAARLERPLVDWARLVPCAEGVDAHAVAAAAPACAVALLLSAET